MRRYGYGQYMLGLLSVDLGQLSRAIGGGLSSSASGEHYRDVTGTARSISRDHPSVDALARRGLGLCTLQSTNQATLFPLQTVNSRQIHCKKA